MTSSTWVRSSASGWKVTTPFVVPFAPSLVQAIRRSGTCSVTVVLKFRRDLKTLTRQLLLTSSVWSTESTPFMKLANSWNWVHWS